MSTSPPPEISSLSLSATSTSPPSTPAPTSPPSLPFPPHLSHSPLNNQKASAPFQFGSRHLLPTSSVYDFNAWDHVAPPAAALAHAEAQYAAQRASPVSAFDAARFNADPAKWWDRFYGCNTANFFKDRKWLRQEFPVLAELTAERAGSAVILEVGAGAGNTAFPIVQANRNPRLRLIACDFSPKAVQLVRAAPAYDERYVRAEVWDVASESLPAGVEAGSVDVVLLIFVFSALSPRQWARAVRNVFRALKPGGRVCFRDYGRGDLAQVRFRKGRWLEENFYVRGDGTRVYFFAEDELRGIWGGEVAGGGQEGGGGAMKEEMQQTGNAPDEERQERGETDEKAGRDSSEGEDPGGKGARENDGLENIVAQPEPAPVFEIVSLGVDRRLLVNRQKQLQMHRCWMQGLFRKPGLSLTEEESSVINGRC